MIQQMLGLIFNPRAQWEKIGSMSDAELDKQLRYPLIMALLPAIGWYVGTTQIGWQVGGGDTTKLTTDSATPIVILFYFALIASVLAIGWVIHWMAGTYGGNSSTLVKGIVISGFTATPIFLIGMAGAYPILWLDLLAGMLAASWALYLLYLGVPAVMHIPENRGFLFSSAVAAVCLVIVVSVMGASIILWEFVAPPVFIDG